MSSLRMRIKGLFFLFLITGSMIGLSSAKDYPELRIIDDDIQVFEKSTSHAPQEDCEWLDYTCSGPYYTLLIPDPYGLDFYNQRFTPPVTDPCTLVTIQMAFYEPATSNVSGEGIDVYIWDDDGNGLPGTIRDIIQVPGSDIIWYPGLTTVELPTVLEFTGDFHIGYTVIDQVLDTFAILSDNPTCGVGRSSVFYMGEWWNIHDLYGEDWNLFIFAEMCHDASSPPNDCTNPIIVDQELLPYLDTRTTCGEGNTYSNTCLGYYDGGEDIIYELDIFAPISIEVTLDPLGTSWTGILLDSNCPPDPGSCIAASTKGPPESHGFTVSLEPGSYYIMIDTWPPPACIPNYELTIQSINQPPIITNLPPYLNGNYCSMIDYDFYGEDPEDDEFWFEFISGPGIFQPEYGGWYFEPTATDLGTHQLVFQICDAGGCNVYSVDINIENDPPAFFSTCDTLLVAIAGDELFYFASALAPEDCDNLTYGMVAGPGEIEPVTGVYSWQTVLGDAGIHDVAITVNDGTESVDCMFQVELSEGYMCGDANGDGAVNLGDAGFVINYIFYDGPAPSPLISGDANDDGSVNLADAGYVINYIFYSGPAPCADVTVCCTAPACDPNETVAITYNNKDDIAADCGGDFGKWSAYWPIIAEYAACCFNGDTWKMRVNKLTANYALRACAQGRTDINAAGDVADLATCKKVVKDLTFGDPPPAPVGRAPKKDYTSTDCTLIHEQTHQDEFVTALDAAWVVEEAVIEALSVPCVIGGIDTPAEAVAAMKAAADARLSVTWDTMNANRKSHKPTDTSDAYTNQKTCHDALIAALKAQFPGC